MKCINCRTATSGHITGQIGLTIGPLCADCAFWCDGNIVEVNGELVTA